MRKSRIGVKSKFGASVPADFDRQKRIFDYLKWHEIHRKESVALFKSKFKSDMVQTRILTESEVQQLNSYTAARIDVSSLSFNINCLSHCWL